MFFLIIFQHVFTYYLYFLFVIIFSSVYFYNMNLFAYLPIHSVISNMKSAYNTNLIYFILVIKSHRTVTYDNIVRRSTKSASSRSCCYPLSDSCCWTLLSLSLMLLNSTLSLTQAVELYPLSHLCCWTLPSLPFISFWISTSVHLSSSVNLSQPFFLLHILWFIHSFKLDLFLCFSTYLILSYIQCPSKLVGFPFWIKCWHSIWHT